MMRAITFLSLLTYCSAAVAMNNKDAINLSITNQWFVYMGTCTDREIVEMTYGRTFPMNTIFVSIKLTRYNKHLVGFDLIPYDYIREKKEGDSFPLTINGKEYTICCNHLNNGCPWGSDTFEKIAQEGMSRFSQCANWLFGDHDKSKTLIASKVIRPGVGSQHGKNKSPYVK